MAHRKNKYLKLTILASTMAVFWANAATVHLYKTNESGTTVAQTKPAPQKNKPFVASNNSSIEEIDNSNGNIQPVPTSVIYQNNTSLPESKITLTIHSGENRLLPISIGQPNRIVTPFPNPIVQYIKKPHVKISNTGNVLYVTSYKSDPIAMYITNKGDESRAISLSINPERRPPVEARLLLAKEPNNSSSNYNSNFYTPDSINADQNREVADKWEKKDTYSKTITKVLKTIALGELPTGYQITNLKDAKVSIPNCLFHTGTPQDNIKYSFSNGQYIVGSKFSVIIGVAQNKGNSTVMVDESLCTHPRLAARALWSNNTLAPNQKTEAYFVIRNTSNAQQNITGATRQRLAE